ncbi:MAG: VanZ family protein [Ruminococcus sp.]|nr:VanZ family protein [Ruminococcus sp.]MDD6531189.1 VanZ family protein [Ruminococcus sp.]
MSSTVKAIKLILSIIIGVVGGYLLYYFVLMGIVAMFLHNKQELYIITSFVVLFLSIVGCIFITYIFTGLKVNPTLFKIVVGIYFVLLLYIFFGRRSLERQFIVNIFYSIKELTTDSELLLQFILNIIVLMPIAYFFKNKGVIFTELIFLVISFGIEIMQYVTARGFFDIIDIVCYMIGMNLAYLFFRLTKVDIVKRKQA